MRISDWSSDVCSSDLEWPNLETLLRHPREGGGPAGDAEKLDSRLRGNDELKEKWAQVRTQREAVTEAIEPYRREKTISSSLEEIGRASCRERGGQGVDSGGRRMSKKKKTNKRD